MYGAIVVRADCAIADRTFLYFNVPCGEPPLPSVIGTGLSLALARPLSAALALHEL